MKLKQLLICMVVIGIMAVCIAYVLKGPSTGNEENKPGNVSQPPPILASPSPTQEIGSSNIVKPSPAGDLSSPSPTVRPFPVTNTNRPDTMTTAPADGRTSTLRLIVYPEDGKLADAKVTLLSVSYDEKTHAYSGKAIDTLNKPNDFWFGQNMYTFSGVEPVTLDGDSYYEVFIECNGRLYETGLMEGQIMGITYSDSWDRIPDGITSSTVYGYTKGAINDTTVFVPGANISLYRCTGYDGGENVNLGLASVANNPQVSGENGQFLFEGVPVGYYDVVAEKGCIAEHRLISLTGDGNNKYQVIYLFPYDWK